MLALDNLANQNQYTNTCSTFEALFAYNIVPVVNENDTVAVEELRFGDNDTLSAKVVLSTFPFPSLNNLPAALPPENITTCSLCKGLSYKSKFLFIAVKA